MVWNPTLSSIVLSSRTAHFEPHLLGTSCPIPESLSRSWPKDSLLCPIDRIASVADHQQAGIGILFVRNVHNAKNLGKGLSTNPDRHDLKFSK
jgi:hypothetical protein